MTSKFFVRFSIFMLLLSAISCKEDAALDSLNPYDGWTSKARGDISPNLKIDPNTIEGLHKNIFKPTCANSGCHDGNFEPDFRSIESSYNTLINRTVTNSDPQNPSFTLRVIPNDADKSMILHRILTYIQGSQGQMPLTTDPGSDWPDKKLQYIQNIKNWINDGAKDQFGKLPSENDFRPQLGGLIVFADGSSTPLPHANYTPVTIPAGTNSIKIMVAYGDDKTPVNLFGLTTFNHSLTPFEYLGNEQTMITESTPYNAKGILGMVDYWHSITVQVSTLGAAPNDVIWLRTQTTDNINPAVYIPETTTSFNTKKYFALRIR